MANKAVFLDRDHTIIADTGYLSDPDAVKLLPGADLAIKSLSQAGYKIVVATNQSGIARGLLTEETLEKIHTEMRRQLAGRGAHVDAIYYCPYHPEGTVERYATESDLCKPRPGLLLKAAEDLDIDLQNSWMVGDSSRDVEAGQRAGCRTVRLRSRTDRLPRETADEDAQADFTVRNLVEAAKIILRQPPRKTTAPKKAAVVAQATPLEADAAAKEPKAKPALTRLTGLGAQILALAALGGAVIALLTGYEIAVAETWALIAVMLQVLALTLLGAGRKR